MDEKKMSSEEVPQRFAEWLLSMGCPSEKVPSVEKLAEMCRGQYYMVWRSLMEHVESKKNTRHKRLQVFCDDIMNCQDNNAFSKIGSGVVVPEELSLWRRHKELREKIKITEAAVAEAKKQCELMVDKVSSKLSHRNLACKEAENAQRRAWLLQQVADELRTKKANLDETKSIAECLCHIENDVDIESKLDAQIAKCSSSQHIQQNARVTSASLSCTLQSSATSNNGDVNDSDEYLSIVKCSAESLWPRLCERRAALINTLNVGNTTDTSGHNTRVNPRSILTHTASLICTLGLEACKNRVHIEKTRARLASELAQLNDLSLSGESCESLVVRCEHACAGARVDTLRTLLGDVTGQRGAFAVHRDKAQTNCMRQIAVIDKAIEMKRDELKKVIYSLGITERKIQKVRECLINVFNSFHSEGRPVGNRGQLQMPQESLISLKSYYENKLEKKKNKQDLSLDLDNSDSGSNSSNIENANPKYVDELRVYLNNFCLENNRKLVLESGQKIWIFETIQSLVDRLHTKLQHNNLSCPIICPSVSLKENLQRLSYLVKRKEELGMLLKQLEGRQRKNIAIDISSQIEADQLAIDKIKKRLNENLMNLQKTMKTLELGQENMKIWSENQIKKYISSARTIEGKTYQEYESYYIRNLDI